MSFLEQEMDVRCMRVPCIGPVPLGVKEALAPLRVEGLPAPLSTEEAEGAMPSLTKLALFMEHMLVLQKPRPLGAWPEPPR